jgi:hypothetical protein
MSRSKAYCHPDRDVRARGLCASCYVMEQRKPAFEPIWTRIDELIEVIQIRGGTWDELEHAFGMTRQYMNTRLRSRKRGDLVDKTHLATYGVKGRKEIMQHLRGSAQSEDGRSAW